MSCPSLQKLVYVAYAPRAWTRSELRDVVIEGCSKSLLASGARRLQVGVADQFAELSAPGFGVPFEISPRALINVWVERIEDRIALEDVMRAAGLELAGYAVDEQIYTEYGGNRHAGPRTWPDGERSPGVLAVTFMERPKRLSPDEWIRRWHGRQSPMSEAMQPRTRYVRNVVQRPLSAGAPAFEGIVEESWPSFQHVRNPFLFYGASNPFELVKNATTMLRSVASFLDLWRIRTVMMSEYFIASETERLPDVAQAGELRPVAIGPTESEA